MVRKIMTSYSVSLRSVGVLFTSHTCFTNGVRSSHRLLPTVIQSRTPMKPAGAQSLSLPPLPDSNPRSSGARIPGRRACAESGRSRQIAPASRRRLRKPAPARHRSRSPTFSSRPPAGPVAGARDPGISRLGKARYARRPAVFGLQGPGPAGKGVVGARALPYQYASAAEKERVSWPIEFEKVIWFRS